MIALVTGGTAGIGYQIAAKLRQAGLNVFITGRDPVRGQATAAQLAAEFLAADHLTVAGNLDLAETVVQRTGQPDVLINNVGGAAFPQRTVTVEGHEAILALNYLGPIALAHALQPANVVQVVSSAFTMHTTDPFTEPGHYTSIGAYARAKQLNLLATMHFARLLGDNASVNAINPGMAWTPGVAALTPQDVPAWRYIWPLVRLIQRRASPEKAARIPARLALAPDGTGRYIDGKPKPLPERLLNPAWQQRAWDNAITMVRPS